MVTTKNTKNKDTFYVKCVLKIANHSVSINVYLFLMSSVILQKYYLHLFSIGRSYKFYLYQTEFDSVFRGDD